MSTLADLAEALNAPRGRDGQGRALARHERQERAGAGGRHEAA
ncbi:MAG: hypothetical protein ACJ8H8_10320 [Geminicoccaceae bacterium]